MKKEPEINKSLCPEAQQFLRDIINALNASNMLTSLDFTAVELLGITYHFWLDAKNKLLKEGQTITSEKGEIKAHPCVKIELDQKIQLTKIMETLGLTPKARKDIMKPKERTEEKSNIEKFLEKAKS